MVKFGRHLQTFLESEAKGCSIYVVPYNDLKDSSDPDKFLCDWNECQARTTECFHASMEKLWKQVFSGIENLAEARGAVPDLALHLYIIHAGHNGAQELLTNVKQIHSAALMNAEALRKLAKKFDKKNSCQNLTPLLLPKLYASNFVLGQNLLESGIAMIREYLDTEGSETPPSLMDEDEVASPGDIDHVHNEEPEEIDQDGSGSFLDKRARGRSNSPPSNVLIQANRLSEFDWLKKMVQSCAPDEIAHIVAHRGFHCINDNDDKRPLENSQSAYEAAWTSGISLCECDIALTRDEKLVLAHDDDFTRLALDPRSEMSKMKVSDLTFKEIMSLPLKSGTRPPLLIDILRSARAIGENAKLIVEIKPGNAEAGTALARLFVRHPVLMAHCAVVMSFDLYAIHNLRKELSAIYGVSGSSAVVPGRTISFPSSMCLGSFARPRSHAVSMGATGPCDENAQEQKVDQMGFHSESADHFGVGLSVSQTDLKHHYPIINSASNFDFNRISSRRRDLAIPKIMLLTVSEPSTKPCELCFDIMGDLSRLDSWLKMDNDMSLDGIYLQFEKCMMTMEGAAKLRELASKYDVGVWGDKKAPDDYNTFHWLVREGRVRFVNSDLPRAFKRKSSPCYRRGETLST